MAFGGFSSPKTSRSSSSSGFGAFGGKRRSSSNPAVKDLDLDSLQAMLDKKSPSPISKGVGFLKGALDIIDRPRNSIASVVQSLAGQSKDNVGQAFLHGLTGQNHVQYGDILKKAGVKGPAAGLGGFAADVILDPLNLVGVGEAAKAIHIGEGATKLALNGAGRDFLQKALGKAGEAASHNEALYSKVLGDGTKFARTAQPAADASREMAIRANLAKMITKDPNLYSKYVDKGGIKIAGNSVLSGRAVDAANAAIKARPIVGMPSRAIAATKNAVVDNFKVGAGLERAGGEKLNDLFGLRQSRIANADDYGKNVAGQFKKGLKPFVNETYKTVEDVSHAIARAAEEPAFRKELLEKFPTYKDPLISFQKVMGGVAKNEGELRTSTKGAGLVENYRPHLFKEDSDTVKQVTDDMAARGHVLSPDAFFLHNRTSDKTVQEIIEHAKTMKSAEHPNGITLTPLNAHESIAARLTASERALANHEFVQAAKKEGVQTNVANPVATLQSQAAKTQGDIEALTAKPSAETGQLPLFDGVKTPTQENLDSLLMKKSNLDKAAEGISAHTAQQFEDIKTARKSGWIEPGIPQLKGVLFPPDKARELTKLIDSSVHKQSGPILEYMDKAMGLYKGLITQPFGAFHARNKIGNVFNGAYLGGVGLDELPRYMKYQGQAYKNATEFISKSGRKFSKQELEKLGVANAGQAAMDGFHESNVLGKAGKVVESPLALGRKTGTYIENADRIALFMNRIDKGDTVEQARAHVDKFLFNYGNQTNTVKNIGKVVPFFTWTANNIPLQLEQMIKQPAKFSHLYSAFNALGQNGDATQNLPDYVKNGLSAVLGTHTDENNNEIASVARNFGLPVEDLNKLYTGRRR
jgi:hypothetical protein